MKRLIFLLLASAGIVSGQNDIVVDNPQAIFEGKWDNSKTSKDRYGDDYRSAFCVQGDATATATFRPDIAVAGNYNVEVMYPRGDNRSTKAPWFISYDGGTFVTNISQKVSGGKWVRIGNALPFATGTAGFVRISNNTGEVQESSFGRTVVIADAVRFVLVSKAVASIPNNSVKTDSPDWRHVIQTSVKGSGSVVKEPDQPKYADRAVVEVTAKPDAGYVFVGWSGDASDLDNPLKLTMTKDVSLTAEFLPQALGAIIESSEAEVDGRWTTNSQKWAGQRSDSYLYAASTAAGESTVTFRPVLPKAGKYDVYVYYLSGDNRASKTIWEVVGKDGTSQIEIDQRSNGRQWFLLTPGKEFEAGTKGYVRITNKGEPIPSVVVADSVAFVYVAPPENGK